MLEAKAAHASFICVAGTVLSRKIIRLVLIFIFGCLWWGVGSLI